MSTLELAGVILSLEFGLLSWGILFLMLRRQRKAAHADHEHAGAVMEHLETTEFSRRDALASLFETTYRLEGDELAAKVDEYVTREKAFYSAMLSLYLNRDGTKLNQIPEELAKVLTPWSEMTPSGMIDASEVSHLENEKAELQTELEDTKNTLEQLMDEYMAAFKRTQDDASKKPPPEPETIEPPPEPDVQDFLMDQDDLDIDTGLSETSAPKPNASESPETAQPIDDTGDQPEEEPMAPEAIEEMLSAFGLSEGDETDEEPSIEPPPAPTPSEPVDEASEDALAREELEKLADLFEDSEEKD